MIRVHRIFCALAVIETAASVQGAAQSAPSSAVRARFVGEWQGVLAVGTSKLRIALSVKPDSAAGLRGQIVSIDQGGAVVPAQMSVRGDTLVVSMPAASATYTAVATLTGDSLHGVWSQGSPLPLAMGRGAAPVVVAKARPQDPKPPFPYRSQDVTVSSVAGVTLAGTVLIPNGTGPFPAVVFVTGSGPQDRDETLLGHHPFLVIADYLARHGIASLRYDDRGVARSTGSFANSTSADFADDAEAAVRFLRGVPGIARDRVGIIGHSEGGLIGPMVAARSPDVAFVVMMAGPGIPGDSISLLQQRLIALAGGAPAARVDASVAANRRLMQAVKTAPDSATAVANVQAARSEILVDIPDTQRAAVAAQIDQGIRELEQPWMRYFLRYDPRPTLRKVHVPVLALGGTLDLQVPPEENLSAIDAALKEGGNRDYRVVRLPGLNHLFQTATTGSPSEYEKIEETVSPSALELMAGWINQRFSR
jgi:uncharacterized protein